MEAIIYSDGQFINASNVEIEIENKNYNLIFNKGERIILNINEKSKTNFDKFIYSIENNEIEILMMDKEHYSTLQLLGQKDNKFFYHGHNRIYQYLLTIIVALISLKIIFLYLSKKNIFKYYIFIFLTLLLTQVINSFLIFQLNNNINFSLYYYYFINFSILLIFCYLIFKINENN